VSTSATSPSKRSALASRDPRAGATRGPSTHVAPIHDFLHIDPRYTIDRRLAPIGTLFSSKLQHLGIKYGPLTEPIVASPIGRVVPEDEDRLKSVGQAVWNAAYAGNRDVFVEVCRSGEEGDHGIRRLTAGSPLVDAVIQEVYDETRRVWLEPPSELARLHAGDIDSGAGSFGTVLTTLVFVNGGTRPLGYATYGALVRAAVAGEVPLESLRRMARLLIATPAEFLGYCGLSPLWSLTRRVVAILDEIDDRKDFLALMSHMALYVNCLNGWNLQMFPWHLGDKMRQARAPDA
jgi:hypothetical protein